MTGLCVLGLFPQRERRKNVHTHVSIVQREGPGYALFSTDGSGVCVHVCWGGGLLECVFPSSVNKQSPPWSQRPRWQDTPLCLHVHSLLILFIYQLISPLSFLSFCPLTWQAYPLTCYFFGFWVHCNLAHSFVPTRLCTRLYMVQGRWPDNQLISLNVKVHLSLCFDRQNKVEADKI